MPVLTHIRALATCRDEGGQDDIFVIDDAALVWEKETIRWVGRAAELPEAWSGEARIDALLLTRLMPCRRPAVKAKRRWLLSVLPEPIEELSVA